MDDFLYALKMELDGKLTDDQIAYQLDLYRDYIIKEMRKNKTEEQVLRKLGDPVLICKLIVESYEKREKENKKQERRMTQTEAEINERIQNPEHGFHAEFKENEGWDIRLGKLKLNTWYGTLIILGVVLGVFVLLSILFPGIRHP
ncbi:MAG TPA: DUF1700 domain-containing protein [Candidatus Eubacterium avistercoris]|uniref:DUF1700 domain-containing protein n=1 Tax=Candidatus Eubacterium avistercoris TaxID=2838567 RepID=A0A9D2D4H1_9FIRM|nr:DUF1700 domain-containing protein [Candidatus Eubacterium avistercoris]